MSQPVPVDALIIEPKAPGNPIAFAQTVLTVGQHGPGRPLLVNQDLVVLHRKDVASACQVLRLRTVEVEIIDPLAYLDEGNGHHDFTPTEIVIVGRLLEEVLEPVARQHRDEGRARASMVKAGKSVEHMPETERLRIRPMVAKALGLGATSYGAAREVVFAAEADPDHFGDLPGEMDRTGIINPAYDELKRRRRSMAGTVDSIVEEPPPRPKAPGLAIKFAAGRDPSVIIQNVMYSLQAAADTVAGMDLGHVTSDDAESWVNDLFDICKALVQFRSRLKVIVKEQSN